MAIVIFSSLALSGDYLQGADAAQVQFNRDIRPLLSDRCFQCHGPDEESREAGLRLDIATTDEGPLPERGTGVIVPGDPEASELWRRIRSDDADIVMPPPTAHKKRFTEAQLELLRQWIEQGAQYQSFWAFDVPSRPSTTVVASASVGEQVDGAIDYFVQQRLKASGLSQKPQADRRTLIRRATFDLTGLPPTQEEIQSFLNDDSEFAYQRLIDRLLASPHCGEHLARYWIDLVRFADTNGIHHDHYREVTPYRDWVIDAFNDNLPFDEFTKWQLAGDLYEKPTTQQLIASGFNRLHLVIDRGTALPEESFVRNVVDRVNAVGTAFMGLTVGCAACHDHKYDPLTQREFYQLYAFFNNIDAAPETPGKGIHEPALRLPTEEQATELAALDEEISHVKSKLKRIAAATQKGADETANAAAPSGKGVTVSRPSASQDPGAIQDPGANPDIASSSQAKLKQQLDELAARKRQLEKGVVTTLIMKERKEIRPTHILVRGAYDQPGQPVDRATPDFLPPLNSEGEVPTRMDLARWLTAPTHPLTARVTVNRYWQQLFGVGLVRTSEDFGAQGETPSHPELLDLLAVDFIESGWDVKRLLRRMMLSATYRQTSHAPESEYLRDPANRLLARGARFRLDAEQVRDQILYSAGLLSCTMYGRSVKPPQPPNLWKNVSMVSSSTYAFEPDEGEKIHRRSLYTFWKRALPPPQMTIFDAPTREACIARRERTNTPLQALVLFNEQQYFAAARQMAVNLLSSGERSDSDRLQWLYQSITSQQPDQIELDQLLASVAQLRISYREAPEAAEQVCRDVTLSQEISAVELASYTIVVNALFNLDITKTRQ